LVGREGEIFLLLVVEEAEMFLLLVGEEGEIFLLPSSQLLGCLISQGLGHRIFNFYIRRGILDP
jgi:hypothetical protein